MFPETKTTLPVEVVSDFHGEVRIEVQTLVVYFEDFRTFRERVGGGTLV